MRRMSLSEYFNFNAVPGADVLDDLHGCKKRRPDPNVTAFVVPMVRTVSERNRFFTLLFLPSSKCVRTPENFPLWQWMHEQISSHKLWELFPGHINHGSKTTSSLIDGDDSASLIFHVYVYEAERWGAPVDLAVTPVQKAIRKRNDEYAESCLKLWIDTYVSALFRLCEAASGELETVGRQTTTMQNSKTETFRLDLYNVFVKAMPDGEENMNNKLSMKDVCYVGLGRCAYTEKEFLRDMEDLIGGIVQRLIDKRTKLLNRGEKEEEPGGFDQSVSFLEEVKHAVIKWSRENNALSWGDVLSCVHMVKNASAHLLDAWTVRRPCSYVWWNNDSIMSILQSSYGSDKQTGVL